MFKLQLQNPPGEEVFFIIVAVAMLTIVLGAH